MKTNETTGVARSTALPYNGRTKVAERRCDALPSVAVLESLGFGRATHGLTAPQVFHLQNVLAFYWQPAALSLRESCRLAKRVLNRHGWRTYLTDAQVRRRFACLDQDMLRNMRACQRN
jgi:hypothetical protein